MKQISKKNSLIREALNLLTCAESNTDTKIIVITLNFNALSCTVQQ